MNLERIYNKIAKDHGVSASEVRQLLEMHIQIRRTTTGL